MGNPHKFVAPLPCPVCGHEKSKVISTKPVETGPFHLVRRRRCISCGFKWYVGQGPEVMVEKVNWVRNGEFEVHSLVPMQEEELVD